MGCGSSHSAIAPQKIDTTIAPRPRPPDHEAKELGAHHVATEQQRDGTREGCKNSSPAPGGSLDLDSVSKPSRLDSGTTRSVDSGLGDEARESAQIISNKSSLDVFSPPKLATESSKQDPMSSNRTNLARFNRPPLPPINTHGPQDSATDSLVPDVTHRPCSRGGLVFDVFMGTGPQSEEEMAKRRRRMPEGVRRLERRGTVATLEELEEKRRAAAQRRKEHEQKMLARIRARHEKERQMQEALAKFAALQSEKEAKVQHDTETTDENRDKLQKDGWRVAESCGR